MIYIERYVIYLSGRLINTNNLARFSSFFVRLISSLSPFKHSKRIKDDHGSYKAYVILFPAIERAIILVLHAASSWLIV